MREKRYIRRKDRFKVDQSKVSGNGVILLRYTGKPVRGVPLFRANGTLIKYQKKKK